MFLTKAKSGGSEIHIWLCVKHQIFIAVHESPVCFYWYKIKRKIKWEDKCIYIRIVKVCL